MAIADWTLTPTTQMPFDWSLKGNLGGCAHWRSELSWDIYGYIPPTEYSSLTMNIIIPLQYAKIQFECDAFASGLQGAFNLTLISDITNTPISGLPSILDTWATTPTLDVTNLFPAGSRTLELRIGNSANSTTL